MARIVNLKHEPDAVARGAVRVDRRTPFGNPFVIGRDGTREQVVARYPGGNVVAEALYKRGLALERLDQIDLARETFQTVVREHPDDNMANLAQQALDRLD